MNVSEVIINNLQTALTESVFRKTYRTCERMKTNRVNIFVVKKVVQGTFHQRNINHRDANGI